MITKWDGIYGGDKSCDCYKLPLLEARATVSPPSRRCFQRIAGENAQVGGLVSDYRNEALGDRLLPNYLVSSLNKPAYLPDN